METKTTNIRHAVPADASRIAELVVTNYRVNFFPIFKYEPYYFGELNVVAMAADYSEGSEALNDTFVYDDGAVKGMIRVHGNEIVKLFVEPQFQSIGIGAELLEYAVRELHANWLWVLKYNERGKAFYRRHGFELNGDEMTEDEWVPLEKMARHTI